MYFALLSYIIQASTTAKTAAIGNPEVSVTVFVSNMPTVIGKQIKAPNALVLGKIISKPPTISVTPTRGINQPISINALKAFCIFSEKFGLGM